MNPDTVEEVQFSLGLIGQWPEPMLLMDGERFVEANKAALALLGYRDKAALLGRSLGEISPPFQPDGEASAGKFHRLLQGTPSEQTLRFEWVLRSAGGADVYVDVTLSPMRHGDRQLLLCAWHEISRLKLAEKAAQAVNEALLKSNLELEQFAQVAAHDLRTPLRTISTFTQLLQREIANQVNEQARQWSTLVVDSSKRMQTLIDDLLSYSRLECEARPFELTDCRSAFNEAKANLFRLIQEAGAEVVCGDLPCLRADRTQLVQVLQNLIENGVKYNTSAQPKVIVAARPQGDAWLFSVTDNGIGIDPSWHERIFQMFRRLHTQQEYPGTGIGLAICQRAIERRGGKIWVESGESGGSVFYFTLPAVPAGND